MNQLGEQRFEISSLGALLGLLGLWLGYRILVMIYNVSPFHPLSKFPGPKVAAASYLYEAYHDWWLVGRYTKVIQRMHEQYGPIVRINPDELHCDDPHFTDEIYAVGGRVRDKWQHQINTAAVGPVAMTGFATVPHELHRVRKLAISKFFSRQQMLKLEAEVQDFAQRVADKLLRSADGKPFDIKQTFNCFTADVISQYAFGKPMGFVDQKGWEPNFGTWVSSFFKSAYLVRHSAVVRKLTNLALPLAGYMGNDIKAVMKQLNVVIPGYVKAALRKPEKGRVFAEIMKSDILPPEEKTLYRLSGEGFNFLLAGTETAAASLTIITYYLLAQPAIYARLMESLQGLDPSNLHWTELEQRPYFWAVIHESLRIMPGGSHRSARIARHEELFYKSQDGMVEWVIPRGTPIGMSAMINHFNEELFPEPQEFKPERWLLDDGQPDYKLQKWLISFGKGSRSCVGEQLAYCELYLMIALMAFRVLPRARLYETTLEDISYDHDMIVVQTKKGSISVRVAID